MKNKSKLRKYHAPVWDERVINQMGSKGRRGLIFSQLSEEIINEIDIGNKTTIKEYANDLWISTQVKSLAAKTIGRDI